MDGRRLQACGCVGLFLLLVCGRAWAQDLNLSPTRPTVGNSATIPAVGVLQVEEGYDAYPQAVPGDQQTIGLNLAYVPVTRLRLDLAWSQYDYQNQGGVATSGVGTITFGGKVIVKQEDYHRPLPGFAFQYEAELPTATDEKLQNYGQQATLLVNHHYGKHGDLDVILNGSVVQFGCQTTGGCSYGGQQSVGMSYHVEQHTRLYAEAFSQNNSASNTPPGTYVFGGFYHQFGEAFGIDGGLRFGVSDHAASFGTTVGLVFGKRLHGSRGTGK